MRYGPNYVWKIEKITHRSWLRLQPLLKPRGLIEKAIAECDRRAELFAQTPEHPQKISEYNTIARRHGKETLPRVLAILDEASAALTALGGAKGALGQALATLRIARAEIRSSFCIRGARIHERYDRPDSRTSGAHGLLPGT